MHAESEESEEWHNCNLCGREIELGEMLLRDFDSLTGNTLGFAHLACLLSEEEADLMQQMIDLDKMQEDRIKGWEW